ncbi:response regulator transcription factor [Novosphingobium aquae]|uniref:Response regulator transcription factor n=1 Tax=Novosphingobium aquae TaxID=3133435 RepID=A0ABU8SDJ8_9SPHN
MQLLVIDRSNARGGLLASRLSNVGFRPNVVRSLAEALQASNRDGATAVLVDQGRQMESCVDLIRPLREGGIVQPLVILSERDDWREKVDCLDAGADDFLVKPIRSEEVAARLRAVVRRGAGISSNRLLQYGIDLDLKQRCAWKSGECLNLSRSEFRLLRLFFLSPGQPVTRNTIRNALWREQDSITENAIEVLVTRLRKKLGSSSIRSIRGQGYTMTAPENGSTDHFELPCR